MAKPKIKPKTKGGAPAHEQEESMEAAEEREEEKESTTGAASGGDASETIEIAGASYHPGDMLSVGDQQVTVVACRSLPASPKSGVSQGTYPIVSTVLQPGNRTVYRALIGRQLYPIREYGSENEVISKIREATAPRKSRKAPSVPPPAARENIVLTHAAESILEDFISLKRGGDPGRLVSDLVIEHLGSEVERLKAAQEAVSKLSADLLTLLAGASEEKRQKMIEMLRE